jgi:hypothetical protein
MVASGTKVSIRFVCLFVCFLCLFDCETRLLLRIETGVALLEACVREQMCDSFRKRSHRNGIVDCAVGVMGEEIATQ